MSGNFVRERQRIVYIYNIIHEVGNLIGIVQNMDWTGLDWTGQLDWTIGLDNWTGQLDWTVGLDYWTGFRMGFFPLNRRNLTDSKVYGMFLRKTK